MRIVGGANNLSGLVPIMRDSLIASIRRGDYNLFLGAGISLDSHNLQGPLINGPDFKNQLCQITGARSSSSLQRVFSSLSIDQIKEHVTDRFSVCEPGRTVERLPSFVWRRLFTLNVDDVIENVYLKPGNKQVVKPYHFKDAFEELRALDVLPVIHLHGWVAQPHRGYVFARSEYARVMAEQNAWMTVLADIMPVEPFIVSGTTLDEIDLEYYLARRSSSSPREDRGPSFFVEPYPDNQTENECERYGLLLYEGTFRQFLDEVNALVPDRDDPFKLLTGNTIDLFSEGVPQSVAMAFAADFDRVPAHAAPGGTAVKFSYGNPPDWIDLASNWDIGRAISVRVRTMAEAMLAGNLPENAVILLEETGSGKSTVLKRVAYDLSTSGVNVVECSALSSLDPQQTAEAIDYIDGPLAVIVDNLAEQASAIGNIAATVEKSDVVFVCAERDYRQRHILRSLGDVPHRIVSGLRLTQAESSQLVTSYVRRGFTASQQAIRFPDRFATRLVGDPIAVACCHILNDMRPIDRIVESTYTAATIMERERFLVAALAQFCFGGGVRYEVLAASSGRTGWTEQFQSAHPLPLDYYDRPRNNFVVATNATLAVRTLERAPLHDVSKAFRSLAMGIAPRVNRDAIRRRTPEARLAGRLFDYDDIIRRFLKDGAADFYAAVQTAWQWNSRYWEQVALFNLALFRSKRDNMYLQQAVRHARHAVAIEYHAFPLTTLGKVLFAQLGQEGLSITATYSEAYGSLISAISLEHAKGRASVQAYVTLFRGTIDFLNLEGELDDRQDPKIREMISASAKYFPRDMELRELSDELSRILA